jgi:hypothetical protein
VKRLTVASALVALIDSQAFAAVGDCSQPLSNGPEPVASDCLFILRRVVGLVTCSPECICAPKGSLPATASDALRCLIRTTGLSVALSCPCVLPTSTSSTSSTTTTIPTAAQCPGRSDAVLYAGVTGTGCSTNADCGVGLCDDALGRCRTAAGVDIGWTGFAHGSDLLDQVRLSLDLVCPGPFQPGTAEPCGTCDVAGISPAPGNCRCNNDNGFQCGAPFAADSASCGLDVSCTVDADCRVCSQSTAIACDVNADCPVGESCLVGPRAPVCAGGQCTGLCQCFYGPPLPRSFANLSACVVSRFAHDLTGTVNVDAGEVAIDFDLRSFTYIGESVAVPCPVCGGTCTTGDVGEPCLSDRDCGMGGVCGSFDPAPQDGLREGTCFLGDNHGDPCDVEARHEGLPAPAGGGHSLDCLPEAGKNISGSGNRAAFREATAVQSLAAGVVCGFPPFAPESCPCGVCERDREIPCSTNVDCESAALGACTNDGLGRPRADDCNDARCSGDRKTSCSDNADCSRCTGDGQTACASNSDCTVAGGRCPGGSCVLEGRCSPVASACTGDATTPCTSNADCSTAGGVCVAVAGECTETGPVDTYCDGVTLADGSAYIVCLTNADCDQTDCGAGIGPGLCGTCSAGRVRRCFLDPVVAVGIPDPVAPLNAALFCEGLTSSISFDNAEGLPGPVRRVRQSQVSYACAGAPEASYVPGIGGCP